MITELVDGEAIAAVITDIVSSVTTSMLLVLSGMFSAVLDWFVELIALAFFDNPAIMLIALIFTLTAWKVSTSG